MNTLALVLFATAVANGAFMAYIRFDWDKNPPIEVVALHRIGVALLFLKGQRAERISSSVECVDV